MEHSKWKKPSVLVVGQCSEPTTVQGIEKLKAFHVSRLSPSTTIEDLQGFIYTNLTMLNVNLSNHAFRRSTHILKLMQKCQYQFFLPRQKNEYKSITDFSQSLRILHVYNFV